MSEFISEAIFDGLPGSNVAKEIKSQQFILSFSAHFPLQLQQERGRFKGSASGMKMDDQKCPTPAPITKAMHK